MSSASSGILSALNRACQGVADDLPALCRLSLRDLAEMFLECGFTFTHEAVRDWEARFAPLLTEQLRAR